MKTLDYGSWPSVISPASLVAGARGVAQVQFDGGFVYWLESRPEEGGRQTILRWRDGSPVEELLDAPFNARSRVHEYGGTSYLVDNGVIWFSNFSDQRLYRLEPGLDPKPITPEAALRYAACKADRSRQRLICVREDHRLEGEAANALVAVDMTGDDAGGTILFDDSDFVSAPAVSVDGSRIAFVSWDHPNMPWDNTTLWSAKLNEDGSLSSLTRHNPDVGESVIDPQWSADGALYALSDRENWWSIYRVEAEQFTPVIRDQGDTEIGGPMWSLGRSYYAFLPDGDILAVVNRGGVEYLARVERDSGGLVRMSDEDITGVGSLAITDQGFATVLGYVNRPSELVQIDTRGENPRVLRYTRETTPGSQWSPAFRLVDFPTGDGSEIAHGVYLPPHNPGVNAPGDQAPPLIVTVHGGPTGVASPGYSLAQQFWTSRGFAILDLNYRGSTGFGREYRRALYGKWGVADVEDAISGARWLVAQGLADPDRLIIRGGSAGGFTVLAAHAFHDTFSAGASHYGISDLNILAAETHKFESRYIDQVIGPYPAQAALYTERSPINHLDGFRAPLIMLQGLDDKVVPPNQSEMIYEALRQRGIAVAYVAFEGEGHGFRKAENIIHAIEAELYFYAQVLGIDVDDDLPGIQIENLH